MARWIARAACIHFGLPHLHRIANGQSDADQAVSIRLGENPLRVNDAVHCVASRYHLIPEGPFPILKPSNAGEAVGMEMAAMAISLLALYLIYRGIRAGSYQRKSSPTQIIASPPQQ